MRQLGVEPTTCWLQVQRPNHYTTEPQIHRFNRHFPRDSGLASSPIIILLHLLLDSASSSYLPTKSSSDDHQPPPSHININNARWKSAQRWRKHCVLAVVRWTHKQTHIQTDRGDYNTLHSSACSVTITRMKKPQILTDHIIRENVIPLYASCWRYRRV